MKAPGGAVYEAGGLNTPAPSTEGIRHERDHRIPQYSAKKRTLAAIDRVEPLELP
jgi:hypothetical protein